MMNQTTPRDWLFGLTVAALIVAAMAIADSGPDEPRVRDPIARHAVYIISAHRPVPTIPVGADLRVRPDPRLHDRN